MEIIKLSRLWIALIAVAIVFLISCERHHQNSQQLQTLIVQKTSLTTPLYFSGNIAALDAIPITSPVDGVVTKMNFNFGNQVKKGDLLFVITSNKQKSNFQTALASYVQAKEKFLDSENTLKENQPLYAKGLISRDEYTQSQDQYYLDQLSLIQAKSTLQDAIQGSQLPNPQSFFSLTLSDIPALTKALNSAVSSEQVKIYALADGIALFDQQGAMNDDNDNSTKIMPGTVVKQDQVLTDIGNLKGLAINIQVDEMSINQIKIGQKASVTGSAFPGVTLQGEVVGKDEQAQTSSDALPTFGVQVVVPNLTDAERQIIHVGMSAKVAIMLTSPPQILIPVNAVIENGDQELVQVIDKSTGKIHSVDVVTGQTTPTQVAITSGLNPGDEIVIPH